MNAIVFATDRSVDRRLRVAGLTLLQRALIVAARAGIRRCLLAGNSPAPRSDRRFPRVTPVADLDDAMAILHSEGLDGEAMLVCLSADVVTTPGLLRRFLERPEPRRSAPLALVSAAELAPAWAAFSAPLREEIAPPPAEGIVARVRDAADARAAEVRLLATLENPRDGRIDALVNRRLSAPLTRLLLRLPLTPNQITGLSFLVAVLAALAFARGTYVASLLGAALFQLSAVLDCCDGEVARARFQESRLGDVLDIGLDAAGNVALLLGIAYGASAAGALVDLELVAWAIGLGVLITFPLVTYAERALPTPAETPEHRLVQRLVASLSTRDFSALVFAAALTATLPWFIRGAAVGANVFWLLLLVLLVRGRAARQP